MEKHLHIVCFDVPYPANYGGAIDVFHKVRCLHKAGVAITLHCFEYGNRKQQDILKQYCKTVYYYQRNTSWLNLFSALPYNVVSRINPELKKNLLQDNAPIVFEVLHTCYLLNDPDLKNRIKLYRHSNIEHEYFRELAKAERSFIKRLYLKWEANKLERFEKQIAQANAILSVSETDLVYFRKHYPSTPSYYLPSFHEFDAITSQAGKGDYILYHGNLSVSENYHAAGWLIDHVFSKINLPVIIAGLNPAQHLIQKIEAYAHIQLKANCSAEEMKTLIQNAQLNCLYTEQGTGLKLKLLNVLFSGKFVLTNSAMITGTTLGPACIICDTASDYLQQINQLYDREFTTEMIEQRKRIIAPMNNTDKTNLLIQLLNA